MAEYVLPCGYLDPETSNLHRDVELREMTGFEEDILHDRSRMRSGGLDDILSRCMVKLGDMERDKPQGQERYFVPALSNMLMADRTFLLIRLRQLSLGDEFPFEATCPHCSHRHPRMSVDLSTLAVKEMEDATTRQWTVTTPAGHKVDYRALTGKEEQKLLAAQKAKTDFFSTLLAQRILSVDGEKVGLAALKRLSIRDRDFLRGAFDAHEGGLETDVELTCEECGRDWETMLPVGESSFFFPSGITT